MVDASKANAAEASRAEDDRQAIDGPSAAPLTAQTRTVVIF